MKINSFEDVVAWQKAKQMTLRIYKLFSNNRDFNFRDQIRSASLSILNNIAEGFERKGDREFSHFLYIAKGSCGEVRSMLYIALELGYISQIEFEELKNLSTEVSKIISGFISKLS